MYMYIQQCIQVRMTTAVFVFNHTYTHIRCVGTGDVGCCANLRLQAPPGNDVRLKLHVGKVTALGVLCCFAVLFV